MQCKICQNDKLVELTIGNIYYYCSKCGLIFIDPEFIVSPEKERSRYEEHNNDFNNKGYVNMFNKFIDKTVRPYIESIDKALDFGCGPGPVLAEILQKEGIKVDIYDPYFFPDKIFAGKKYDLITATEVFEHLQEPFSIMETLINHLNSGGYLAIMTNFHPGVDKFKDWYYHRDITHITFYNPKSLMCLVSQFPVRKVFDDNESYFLAQKY